MTTAWKTLVEQARSGDGSSIDLLLEENLPALRAYVRLRMSRGLRAKETSSDIVQSACREVLADLGRFEVRDEGSFRHWLFETALRKILDRQRYWHAAKRDTGREVTLPDSANDGKLLECYSSISTPSGQAQLREEIERLEQAFDRMPEHYRQVVTLARIVRLSHAQIAEEMGRTEDSVRNLLPRALARLGTLLAVRS